MAARLILSIALLALAASGTAQDGIARPALAATSHPTPRPAISDLKRVGPQRLARVLRSGLSVRVTASAARTRLAIGVKLGGRTVATKARTVGKGAARVGVELSAAGRRRLRAGGKELTVGVTGSSSARLTVTLTRNVKIRR